MRYHPALKVLAVAAAIAAGCGLATAQAVGPFFAPGPVAFEPEISIVNTGVVHDVQATVSPDRKYVTIGARESNSTLLALREFQFSSAGGSATAGTGAASGNHHPLGFVGGIKFKASVVPEHMVNAPMVLSTGNGEAILTQAGMTPVK